MAFALIIFLEYNYPPESSFTFFSQKRRERKEKSAKLLTINFFLSYLSSFHKTKIKNFLRNFPRSEGATTQLKFCRTQNSLVSTCTKFVFNWHQTFRKSFTNATIKQDMKTATQLFPSSYLQPNNIDWIDGILEEKTREKFTILCVVFVLLFVRRW